MIRTLHIANERRRDAEVVFESMPADNPLRTLLPSGEEPVRVRLLKATAAHDAERVIRRAASIEAAATALIERDDDLDIETTGRILRRTRRLYVDPRCEVAYRLNLYRVVRNPDGSERERHDLNKLPGNVNSEIPLRWSGRYYTKEEAVRRFVFTRTYRLRHLDGATFDFLYDMARLLHRRGEMVLIGAGRRGTDPLLLNRGGQPYRALLEGRIRKEQYLLLLHLTDTELKGLSDENFQ